MQPSTKRWEIIKAEEYKRRIDLRSTGSTFRPAWTSFLPRSRASLPSSATSWAPSVPQGSERITEGWLHRYRSPSEPRGEVARTSVVHESRSASPLDAGVRPPVGDPSSASASSGAGRPSTDADRIGDRGETAAANSPPFAVPPPHPSTPTMTASGGAAPAAAEAVQTSRGSSNSGILSVANGTAAATSTSPIDDAKPFQQRAPQQPQPQSKLHDQRQQQQQQQRRRETYADSDDFAMRRAEAAWRRERASLQSACDALNATLSRERTCRADAERRAAAARAEVAALRDALSAALGTAGPSTSGVMVPLAQYTDLLARAKAYRQTLEDLRTLQATLRDSDRSGDHAGGVVNAADSMFLVFPIKLPPLPHNPLADDVAVAASSTDLTFRGGTGSPPPVKAALTQPLSATAAVSNAIAAPPPVGAGRRAVTPTPSPFRNDTDASVGGIYSSPPPPPPALQRVPLLLGAVGDSSHSEAEAAAHHHHHTLDRGGTKESASDWLAPSPPPHDPAVSYWREPNANAAPTAASGVGRRRGSGGSGDSWPFTAAGPTASEAEYQLARMPQVKPILPGKLDLEVYPYHDSMGREKNKQRWVIANHTRGVTCTVEVRFADAAARMALLSPDARFTQDGRYVLTVPPGERSFFLEGSPGRHTVIVRCDGSDEHPQSGGASAKRDSGVGAHAGGTYADDDMCDSQTQQHAEVREASFSSASSPGCSPPPSAPPPGAEVAAAPSRRSATLPPPPPTPSSTHTQPFADREAADPTAASAFHRSGLGFGGSDDGGWQQTRMGGSPPPPPLHYRVSSAAAAAVASAAADAAMPVEDAIAETDRLMMALAEEVRALGLSSLGTPASAATAAPMDAAALAALCAQKGIDFVDLSFPPVTASLGSGPAGFRLYDARGRRTRYVRWYPANAVATTAPSYSTPHGSGNSVGNDNEDAIHVVRPPLSSVVGVDPCALQVGAVGDAGVVAALAALAEVPAAVTGVFSMTTADDEAAGVFSVWLCPGGEWRLVRVDAYLPYVVDSFLTVKGASGAPRLPYGCVNVISSDLWGSMCEKAMAKLLGSYRALRDVSTARALAMLTGGPVEVWDWWHRRSDTAFEEMEAAISTNARGTGIVCITTRTAISTGVVSTLRRFGAATAATSTTCAPQTTEEVEISFRAAGLEPNTTYRVLATAENANREPMLLIRNWQRRSQDEARGRPVTGANAARRPSLLDRKRLSPLRGDSPISADPRLCEVTTEVRDSDSCLWLNYTREVLPFFESCHVCFDCRRYHDVRVPIVLTNEHCESFAAPSPSPSPASANAIASASHYVPSHLLRVTVKAPRRRPSPSSLSPVPRGPARLWLGLHQPGGATSRDTAPSLRGLRLTLVGHDTARTANNRRHRETALRRPAYYVLSESYGGKYQTLPAVWMYVELDLSASTEGDTVATAAMNEGSLTRDTDQLTAGALLTSSDSSEVEAAATARALTFYVLPQMQAAPTRERSHFAKKETDGSGSSLQETAFLALLAEDKSLFDVEMLVAPTEMRAAVYHDAMDCLDLDQCEVVKGPSKHRRRSGTAGSGGSPWLSSASCQVNGQWQEGFLW